MPKGKADLKLSGSQYCHTLAVRKCLGLLFINARVTAETREVPTAPWPTAVESCVVLTAAMELETMACEERLRNWFM